MLVEGHRLLRDIAPVALLVLLDADGARTRELDPNLGSGDEDLGRSLLGDVDVDLRCLDSHVGRSGGRDIDVDVGRRDVDLYLPLRDVDVDVGQAGVGPLGELL
jgi:hypothetical protein